MCGQSFYNFLSYSVKLNIKLLLFILFISITIVNCRYPSTVTTSPIDSGNAEIVDISKHRNLNLITSRFCGPIVFADRLSGGNATELSQYPWMAILQYQTSSGMVLFCGGSLISDRYVLTAAHCLNGVYRALYLSVRLGEHEINSVEDCDEQDKTYCAKPVQNIPVEKIIVHPQFDLKKSLTILHCLNYQRKQIYQQKMCLPITPELRTATLKKLKVTGWGLTEKGKFTNVLLQADVPFVPFAECQKIFGDSVQLKNYQICAGGEIGVDTCKGDSGGPLVSPGKLFGLQFIQYGIVSYGVDTCSLSTIHPGVYTNVVYFMKWILDELEQ